MRFNSRVLLLVGIGATGLLLTIILARRHYTLPEVQPSTAKELARTVPSSSPPSLEGTQPTPSNSPLTSRLDEGLVRLRNLTNPDEARRLLAELRTYLLSLRPDVASKEIQGFLASKGDAPTRMVFAIGLDGSLIASSLRVFLLDLLGQVDPKASTNCARKVLDGACTAPDEWAVCLRNYALGASNPETQSFVRQKAEQLIQNPFWQRQPSNGFLEAFDVIVYTQDTGFVPTLSTIVQQQDDRALAHAGFLTLDRLTLAAPTATLAQMQAQPDSLRGREAMRANLFARADTRDPQQKAILEAYLLDSRRSVEELNAFAQIYPNANLMVSNNLLTSSRTLDREAIEAGDRAALETLNKWLVDPRFQKMTPQLQVIKNRLSTFVRQAGSQTK